MTQSEIVDANTFFDITIKKHRDLTSFAKILASNIPVLTKEELQFHCATLGQAQKEVAAYDGKIVEILNFAGIELCRSSLVAEYRMALTGTINACDRVHDELTKQREKTAERSACLAS